MIKKKPGQRRSEEPRPALAAEFVDASVHNLSSVVVLARVRHGRAEDHAAHRRRARAISSSRACAEAKLLTNGRDRAWTCCKVPHHGSRPQHREGVLRNGAGAGHYVVSANGRDDNPDPPTFDLICSRPGRQEAYDIWLTNDVAPAVNRPSTGTSRPASRCTCRRAQAPRSASSWSPPFSGEDGRPPAGRLGA